MSYDFLRSQYDTYDKLEYKYYKYSTVVRSTPGTTMTYRWLHQDDDFSRMR